MMPSVFADFGTAVRSLRQRRTFAALVVGTLALGVGLTTAVYSVVDAVLIKRLPYHDPARLVAVWKSSSRDRNLAKTFDTYDDFVEWRATARSVDAVAALTWAVPPRAMRLRSGEMREVLAIPASANFFSTLGVDALHGRTFSENDGPCAVVLSHRFWRDAYAGDARVVGTSMTLDGASCSITGIMPGAFSFYPDGTDMWTLMSASDPAIVRDARGYPVGVFARLKSGIRDSVAAAELRAIFRRRNPAEQTLTPIVRPLQDELVWLTGRNLRGTLLMLFAAVGFVLLIACVNAAHLLLGRSLAREREYAVRLALGARPRRLIQQVVAEGLVLSIVGSLIGLGIAWGVLRYLRAAQPVALPPGTTPHLDVRIVLFAAGLALLTGAVFSAIPAWRAARTDVVGGLKTPGAGAGQSRRARRASRVLVVAELTLSVTLLAGASLMITSIKRMGNAPLGFRVDHVLTMRVQLPRNRYAENDMRSRYFEELSSQLASSDGATGAAVTTAIPAYGGTSGVRTLQIDGDAVRAEDRRHDISEQNVTPEYFRVMNERLREGRAFESADRAGSPAVAVINEALATRYFAGTSAIGKRIRIGDRGETELWVTIIGVVGDEQRGDVAQEMAWVARPVLFRPFAQRPSTTAYVVVATSGDPVTMSEPARGRAIAIERDAVIGDIRTMENRLGAVLAYPLFRARVVSGFAVLSLVLAAVGLFGVLSQLVTQRTREFGIRMAVGARQRDIGALVLREILVVSCVGLGAGIAIVLAAEPLMARLLYGVAATDPVILFSVVAGLAVTALLASILPTLRAARTAPIHALRSE